MDIPYQLDTLPNLSTNNVYLKIEHNLLIIEKLQNKCHNIQFLFVNKLFYWLVVSKIIKKIIFNIF